MRFPASILLLVALTTCGPASSQTGQSELVGPPPHPTAAGLCADPDRACCLYWCKAPPCDCTANNRKVVPPDMAPPPKALPPDEDF